MIDIPRESASSDTKRANGLDNSPHGCSPDPRAALLDAVDSIASSSSQRTGLAQVISGVPRGLELCWEVSRSLWGPQQRNGALRHGVVFTPPSLARAMADKLIPGRLVVDLGAGTGMLAFAAAERGFQVIAVEHDEGFARLIESLADVLGFSDRVKVVAADALSYSGPPNSQIISNPPYTRHHLLETDLKRKLQELALNLGVGIPQTAGHYAYFMLRAWLANWSKNEVLLVPTNWLETRYGKPLREILRKRSYELAVADPGTTGLFAHAYTTTCIVTTSSDSAQPVAATDQKITLLGDAVPPSTTASTSLGAWRQRLSPSPAPSGHLLGEVFRTRRGLATGSNEFFLISADDAEELSIPRSELVPVIRSLAGLSGVETQYLWVTGSPPSEASRRRIAEGEARSIHLRYLCKTRNPWWQLRPAPPPDFLLTYMGHGRPKLLANGAGLVNLNSTHGLYRAAGVSEEVATRISAWLTEGDGGEALLQQARHYQGGLWKLEPGDVAKTPIPEELFAPSEGASPPSLAQILVAQN